VHRHQDTETEPPDFGDEAAKLLRSAARMMALDADHGYIANRMELARMAGRLEALACDLDRMEIAKAIYATPHLEDL
jgi:hypothetical protein